MHRSIPRRKSAVLVRLVRFFGYGFADIPTRLNLMGIYARVLLLYIPLFKR